MLPYIRAIATTAAFALFACSANASKFPSINGFLCLKQGQAAHEEFISYLSSSPANQDGGKILGPIFPSLQCLSDFSVLGSFGVLMATGTFCSSSQEEIIKWLKANPELESTNEIKDRVPLTSENNAPFSGVAAFKIHNEKLPHGLLVVYKGEPSFEPKQNSLSNKISFMCVRQASGPQ